MGLKSGYKQTEVGVIPEDWEIVPIGEMVTDFRGGASLKPSDFTRTGVKVLPKGGVGRSGWLQIEDTDTKYCSAEYASAHLRSQVDESFTIVVLRDLVPTGPSIGLMVQIRGRQQFLLAQGVYGFRVNEFTVPGYLVQVSNTRWYRKLANAIMVGSTQVHITNTAFKRAQIPRPPRLEQGFIAEALSDADALIESLEQLLIKKRYLKQGAMQELLTGKKRLPGFSGKWEERTLFDLAEGNRELFDDGDWIEAEHITDRGIRLVQTGNIGVGEFLDRPEKKYIFEPSFVSLRCKEIREGDLLICRLAEPAGRACVLPNIGETKIVTSVDVTVFRPPSSSANRVFLAALFSTDRWFRAVNDRSGGTTHKRVSRGSLGQIRISLPDIDEQTATAAILSDMDAEIVSLEAKLSKARQLKLGMMQELLSGKIRLV
jgi:type I restriction enzyme S subunit